MANNTPWILNQDYTAVPHSILECLFMQTELPTNTIRVLCYLMRMTWGYRKKSDFIPSWQIAKDMRMNESAVSRALKNLTRYGIIIRKRRHITIEQYWQTWLLPSIATLKLKLSDNANIESNLPSTASNEANTKNDGTENKFKKLPSTASKVAVLESKVAVDGKATPIEINPIEINPIESHDSQKIKEKNKIPGLPPGVTDEFALKIEANERVYCIPTKRTDILRAVKAARDSGIDLPVRGNGGTPKSIPGNRPAGAFADLIEREMDE